MDIFSNEDKYLILDNEYHFVFFDGFIFGVKKENWIEYFLENFQKKELEKINGTFNCFVIDKKSGELYTLNDKYGIKPLFYFQDDDCIVYSPLVEALLHNSKKYEIDWSSWADFFVFTYILGDKTYFKEIRKVQPASLITYKEGSSKTIKYWDFKEWEKESKVENELEIQKESEKVLKKVVEDVLVSVGDERDKIIVNLSGGYDSRLILAALVKYGGLKPKTYTSEKYPIDNDDIIKAKKIADFLNCDNHSVDLGEHLFRRFMREKYENISYSTKEHTWYMPLIKSYQDNYINMDGYLGDAVLGDTWDYNFGEDTLFDLLAFVDEEIYSKIFYKSEFLNVKEHVKNRFNMEFAKYKGYDRATFQFMMNNKAITCTLFYMHLLNVQISTIPFFFHDDFLKFCVGLPLERRLSSHIYKKIFEYNFGELVHIGKANNSKMKILYKIRKIMLEAGLMGFIGHKLRRKYWFKYKQEDVDFIVESIKKEYIPEVLNKNIINRIIKKSSNDSSMAYYLEQILVFVWWYNKHINFIES